MDSTLTTLRRVELIRSLGCLLDPENRGEAIAQISTLLGIETFLIFVQDAEVGKLLVAPGFPQTLPDRGAWHECLSAISARSVWRGSLPWPQTDVFMPALGLKLGATGLAVLLGGSPTPEVAEGFAELLRLITPGLGCECTVASVAVQLQLARQVTRESSALAASLDEARRAAQAEVAARKEAEVALRQARDELAHINAELELRVRERTEKLEETVRELETFSYTIAHDLRAPLRAMYGYADVVLNDAGPKLGADEREYLARITRAGQRLDHMIQDVLRYSRVSRADIALQPMDIERVVRDVIGEYPTLRAQSDHIEIVRPLGMALAHELLLSQCLSNLLLNAVKFVRTGVPPRVRIYSENQGKLLRVWIEDNGIGIEPQHVGRLFGMFERVHPSRSFEGNGIGLAIAKRAVNRMGGDVGVESTPSVGSRFWLDLQQV